MQLFILRRIKESDLNMTEQQNKADSDNKEEPGVITFAEFLVKTPPLKTQSVVDLFVDTTNDNSASFNEPKIKLYCDSATCKGYKFFESANRPVYVNDVHFQDYNLLIKYTCRNCKKTTKEYSIKAYGSESWQEADIPVNNKVLKLGEYPVFAPSISSEVLKLIKSDKNLFLKGLESENNNLGIGAFSYYRRVVENQKNHLIDQIIKVSEKLKASPKIIEDLKKAKENFQFSTAVEQFKPAIPESLLIDGCHNPLNLLHGALSAGLHAKSDDACLELAHDIRNVLTDLSERLNQSLKDDEVLKKSVSRLLNHHKQK